MSVGLLYGKFKRDPGYPQPVWHLRIPNLWKANVAWPGKKTAAGRAVTGDGDVSGVTQRRTKRRTSAALRSRYGGWRCHSQRILRAEEDSQVLAMAKRDFLPA